MLLGDYFAKRCGSYSYIGLSTTSIEFRAFKIPDKKHGWIKRIKDMEVPDQIIIDTCKQLIKQNRIKPKVLNRIKGILESLLVGSVDHPVKFEVKDYLYIMQNEIGMYKLGISKTPERRCENLCGASGLDVELIAYFQGHEPAKDIEKQLFVKFNDKLKRGEWFKPNSITIEEIVDSLPKSYKLIYCKKGVSLNKLD